MDRFDLILLGDDVSRTAESNKLGVTDMFLRLGRPFSLRSRALRRVHKCLYRRFSAERCVMILAEQEET